MAFANELTSHLLRVQERFPGNKARQRRVLRTARRRTSERLSLRNCGATGNCSSRSRSQKQITRSRSLRLPRRSVAGRTRRNASRSKPSRRLIKSLKKLQFLLKRK